MLCLSSLLRLPKYRPAAVALYQLYDVFPQQDVFWIDGAVVMVVTKQPASGTKFKYRGEAP